MILRNLSRKEGLVGASSIITILSYDHILIFTWNFHKIKKKFQKVPQPPQILVVIIIEVRLNTCEKIITKQRARWSLAFYIIL